MFKWQRISPARSYSSSVISFGCEHWVLQLLARPWETEQNSKIVNHKHWSSLECRCLLSYSENQWSPLNNLPVIPAISVLVSSQQKQPVDVWMTSNKTHLQERIHPLPDGFVGAHAELQGKTRKTLDKVTTSSDKRNNSIQKSEWDIISFTSDGTSFSWVSLLQNFTSRQDVNSPVIWSPGVLSCPQHLLWQLVSSSLRRKQRWS